MRAQTHPGNPPFTTPHQVNGAVGPRQVQMHQRVGLCQETVEGLGGGTEGCRAPPRAGLGTGLAHP